MKVIKPLRFKDGKLQRLRLFTDGVNTVIAFDSQDAIKAYEEWSGDTWDDTYEPMDTVIPDKKVVKIHCEPDDFQAMKKDRPLFSWTGQSKNYPFVAAPAWAWAMHEGRGFLCSTEW